jgi:hypothetical protein
VKRIGPDQQIRFFAWLQSGAWWRGPLPNSPPDRESPISKNETATSRRGARQAARDSLRRSLEGSFPMGSFLK